MNIALCTTTVHLPLVLGEYRRINGDVEILVAGDVNGPQDEIAAYCAGIRARYIGPQEQEALGYAVSPIIGFKCMQRRAVAILEAIRSRADLIMLVDTDNGPAVDDYFDQLDAVFEQPASAICDSRNGWFNVGDSGDQGYIVRGLPLSQWHEERMLTETNGSATVGVFSSFIFGDPDIAAIERICCRPVVDSYYGGKLVAVNPKHTWTPINSQATTWRRDLAPLTLLPPGIGRFDDIWGGFIAQRVMQATDDHVAFGFPAVIHERHEHDLLTDLEAELHGMRHTDAFVALLKEATVSPDASVLDNLAAVVEYLVLAAPDCVLPQQSKRFLRAWVEDVGRVL